MLQMTTYGITINGKVVIALTRNHRGEMYIIIHTDKDMKHKT
jgi:hypothetical protein